MVSHPYWISLEASSTAHGSQLKWKMYPRPRKSLQHVMWNHTSQYKRSATTPNPAWPCNTALPNVNAAVKCTFFYLQKTYFCSTSQWNADGKHCGKACVTEFRLVTAQVAVLNGTTSPSPRLAAKRHTQGQCHWPPSCQRTKLHLPISSHSNASISLHAASQHIHFKISRPKALSPRPVWSMPHRIVCSPIKSLFTWGKNCNHHQSSIYPSSTICGSICWVLHSIRRSWWAESNHRVKRASAHFLYSSTHSKSGSHVLPSPS